jgi:hypothetical protein
MRLVQAGLRHIAPLSLFDAESEQHGSRQSRLGRVCPFSY